MQNNKISFIYIGLAMIMVVLGVSLTIFVFLNKEQGGSSPKTEDLGYQVVPPGPLGGSVKPLNQAEIIQATSSPEISSFETIEYENVKSGEVTTSTYRDAENQLSFNYLSTNIPYILKDNESTEVYSGRSFIVKITTDSDEIIKLADRANKGPHSSDMEENINGISYRVLSHGEGAAGSTYVETYFIAHKNDKYYVFGFLDRYCNVCDYESEAAREAVNSRIDENKYSTMKTVRID